MNTTPRFPCIPSPPRDMGPRTLELVAIVEPLAETKVAEFGQLLDADLLRLEERFASFVTRKSLISSLAR